jgi:uncharacterized protein YbjT (DUF2867 family)
MILITGVTGKAGGEFARQLTAAGVPFRALVRNPDKAAEILPGGADVMVGDVADKESLARALNGIEKAFLVLPNNEQQLVLEKQFTDAAVAAGVSHLVYLSSLESVPESKNPITRNHVASETYIRASDLTWTMIRPTFFMQNFESSAARIKTVGQIVMPAGNGTVSTTDLRDVGEIIMNVLTQSGHQNKSYDRAGVIDLCRYRGMFFQSARKGYSIRRPADGRVSRTAKVDQPVGMASRGRLQGTRGDRGRCRRSYDRDHPRAARPTANLAHRIHRRQHKAI